MAIAPPAARPRNPAFSSGPCAKRPQWRLEALSDAAVGRSHRSAIGKAKLQAAIARTRDILGVPDDYRIGIVPASDTGAFEMAMWSLLGERPVDALAWESFGQGWVTDLRTQLRLKDLRVFEAPYGALPPLADTNSAHDIVFTWNGTTSGVCVPDGDWIDTARTGLTLCDATSAAFAVPLPWERLDVTTFSWQKVLGGEGAHGMLVLSPRAIARLESYTPPWPLPKIFRLTSKGKLNDAIFEGATINTPSLLATEDYLDALAWAHSIGGMAGLHARVMANKQLLADWVAQSQWLAPLCAQPELVSPTSPCFVLEGPAVADIAPPARAALAKSIARRLEDEGVAYDIGAYRDAPAGFRIWTGATIEADDLRALSAWLDWAFAVCQGKDA